MMKSATILVLLSAVALLPRYGEAQITRVFQRCPAYTTDATLTAAQLMAPTPWFIYRQTRNVIDVPPRTCKQVTFTAGVVEYVFNQNGLSNAANPIQGGYTFPTATNRFLALDLPNSKILGADSLGNANWWVIDYVDNGGNPFMLVKVCTNAFLKKPYSWEYAFVLTSEQVPAAASVTAITAAITANGFTNLEDVIQTGCI